MRHDIDVSSLLLGLAFAAVAVAGLNGWFRDVVASPDLWEPEVVVAAVLVALGLLLGGMIAGLLGRRRQRERARAAEVDPPATGVDGAGSDPADERVQADA